MKKIYSHIESKKAPLKFAFGEIIIDRTTDGEKSRILLTHAERRYKRENHIFLLIYNPPASSQFRIPAKMLTDSIRYFNSKLINGSSYTILGDLNLPDICWASSDGGCDYSKLFLEVIEDHSLMPLIYEPTHSSGNTLDIILTSHTELFTAFVNEVLYSDHFPLFAFFTIPEAAPTVIGNFMKSSLSKSSFSHSIFNSNISPCFTKLIVEQNSCYCISTTNDYVDSLYAQINHAILLSCAHKTIRRQQLPYNYSLHTVYLLNKHHSISKRTANTNPFASIQQDLNNSIELDKTCLLESLRPNSTRDCFKYLRSFTKRKLPNQMHWMNRKASISIEIAILLNDYFCSVFLEKHEIQILQPEKPTIFLSDLHVNIKKVEKALELAKTSCITNDRLPTFILNCCSELISPLVVQLFVKVLETKTWPELWKCMFITPTLKSSNPEMLKIIARLAYCLNYRLFWRE